MLATGGQVGDPDGHRYLARQHRFDHRTQQLFIFATDDSAKCGDALSQNKGRRQITGRQLKVPPRDIGRVPTESAQFEGSEPAKKSGFATALQGLGGPRFAAVFANHIAKLAQFRMVGGSHHRLASVQSAEIVLLVVR